MDHLGLQGGTFVRKIRQSKSVCSWAPVQIGRGVGPPHARRHVRLRRKSAAGRGLRPSSPAPAARRTCRACWRPRPRCRCWACRCQPSPAGVDSLHSIVQMPKGIPVATFAIGAAGAANAALFAVAMLANGDPALRARLDASAPPDRGRACHDGRT
jgi:hypothetical protein